MSIMQEAPVLSGNAITSCQISLLLQGVGWFR